MICLRRGTATAARPKNYRSIRRAQASTKHKQLMLQLVHGKVIATDQAQAFKKPAMPSYRDPNDQAPPCICFDCK